VASIMNAAIQREAAHVIATDQEALQIAHAVAQSLATGASALDKDRRIPYAELDELSASGLLAVTVPREFGGAGVSRLTIASIFQILGAADPAVTQMPHSHFVFLEALREDGSDQQKRFFFGEILAGARLGNAQAEQGSNSALDLKTRLLPTPDGSFRLNGTKHYCTGAITAHWIPVAALDQEQRLVLAYVPKTAPGVEVLADWNAMGQRVSYSGTTKFHDVAVPAGHVVEHWRLFERPAVYHPFAQLLHAAIDVGIAQNALEEAAGIIRRRKRARLGAKVAQPTEDPLLLHRFGQLWAKFHAAEVLVQRAARFLDAADAELNADSAAAAAVAVAEAKAFTEDVAVEISSEVFALIGSSATDENLNLNRHWRNVRTHSIHDANQWNYHTAGNYHLNGAVPGKPVRQLAKEGDQAGD
jgi:SfnB family sulfur acquisition oxidoreductase